MKKTVISLVIGLWSSLALCQANNLITNLFSCGENNVGSFNLNMATSQALNGYNPSDFLVSFYVNMGDLNTNNNAISNTSNYLNVSNPQTIYMKIVNINTSEITVKNFDLEVVNTPPVSSQTFQLCDSDNNGMESTTDYLSSFNPYFSFNNSYEVKYFHTYADTVNSVNEIQQNDYYTFVGYGQHILYARVQKANTDCYSISTLIFNLSDCAQNGLPQPLVGCLPTYCFDLTQNTYAIIYSLNPVNYYVTYFTTENDAINNTNPITNTTNYCTSSDQVIYARLSNIQNSNYQVFPFDLFVVDCTENPNPGSFYANFCIDQGQTICEDFTNYNSQVIGTLNPALYTISYHLTQLDADTDTNPIVSPYCVGEGYYLIYSRIENNTNPTLFYSSISYINITTITLTDGYFFNQCDDNDDGIVLFNLTDSEIQTGYTNLTYYNTLSDATNQVNPINNPTNSTMAAMSFTIVYGRYNQPDDCDYLFQININTFFNCVNPFQCVEANSLCGALGEPFLNNQYSYYDEPNANYGCLASHPNPTWFYMQANQNGSINLKIEQNTNIDFSGQLLDVDYIIYGPYTNPQSGCSALTEDKIVNCSYSAQSTEFPVILNPVAGQYYLIMVTNFSNQQGYIRITDINQELGALDCSGIELQAFIDTNNNTIKDNSEQSFPFGQFHIEKNNSGTIHHVSSNSGSHTFYDTNQSNSYDISYTIFPDLSSYYSVTTSSYSNIIVDQNQGIQTYYFPIVSTQNYTDVAVSIVSNESPRPGFDYYLTLIYTNQSNQVIPSGTVNFSYENGLTLASVSQSGITLTSNGFNYGYSNLLPFETRYIYIVLNVPTTFMAGESLVNTASITPIDTDINSENNIFSINEDIINSYDPNDKMESHGDKIVHSTFTTNDYLYYTIRFENTGTASAVNIKITDVLDSKLNPSTLQVISASHNYTSDVTNAVANFEFRKIQLPVAILNTQIGHGFITFRIKPYANFAIGDIIPNNASIYFDFNPAIVTNTFTTEFVESLGNENFAFINLNYFPNPVKNNLTISNTSLIETVEITSILGQNMLSQKINSLQTEINLSELSSGIYFVKVTSEEDEKTIKIIKE